MQVGGDWRTGEAIAGGGVKAALVTDFFCCWGAAWRTEVLPGLWLALLDAPFLAIGG